MLTRNRVFLLADKKQIYKLIKLAGLVTFIPFVLVSGPIAAFVLGSFLQKKFFFSEYYTYALVVLGFAISIIEVIKILRKTVKIEKDK
ncbi:MAG: hypothetical protein PHO70_05325 [Candidatus Omnitrophica bacterium]|nr:hypothetical protein [Candidatus Omnitrophota bacterium]